MSNILTLKIAPRGSIVVRDGRPFAATPGARAVSLPWPLPGTVAGMARTRIGNDLGFNWQGDGPDRARRIDFRGPLPLAQWPGSEWTVCLAAPRDGLVPRDTKDIVYPLRPVAHLEPGAGCDLPYPSLRPLDIPTSEKADTSAAYWPLAAIEEWLAADAKGSMPLPQGCLGELPRDTRMHVAMDHDKDAALEGALFATEGLAFADLPVDDQPARAMLCQVIAPDGWTPKATYTYLGGERRLVHIESVQSTLWPAVPDASAGLGKALAGVRRIRLLLATPALFGGGWRPNWLDGDLVGHPPEAPSLRLRLVAAAMGRRTAVSGWDLTKKGGKGSPKAARFMVPAGSVYFFEVLDGDPGEMLQALWLAPLSDTPQDRADGYGLALPGIW